MSAAPQWSPVDDDTTDLLALVAMGSPSTGTADQEWSEYLAAMRYAAGDSGRIDPNVLRPLVRGVVHPKRIAAFTHRALTQGLITWTGDWQVSDDTEGRNAGRPCRIYQWNGGAR